jgi:toxin FitB
MIIVDTNVAAELMRPAPSATVADWVRSRARSELYTTAITVAEIRYGIERLPDGHRKELLRQTANQVFTAFNRNVLAFDVTAALHYSWIVTGRDQAGLPIDAFDAQIAAICWAQGAVLATRNMKDFRETGIDLLDPWQPG